MGEELWATLWLAYRRGPPVEGPRTPPPSPRLLLGARTQLRRGACWGGR